MTIKKKADQPTPSVALAVMPGAHGSPPMPPPLPPAPALTEDLPLPMPVVPKLPLPLSSFRVDVGGVDELTWTPEDQVIKALKWNRSEEQVLQARVALRRAAKHSTVVARRNPEHGYWEYGPQWRSKEFQTLLDAAHSAALLGAVPGAVS